MDADKQVQNVLNNFATKVCLLCSPRKYWIWKHSEHQSTWHPITGIMWIFFMKFGIQMVEPFEYWTKLMVSAI
jgi:hypothetical protein